MRATLIRAALQPSGRLLPFVLAKDQETVESNGRRIITLNDTNASVAAAAAGLGIVCVPSFLVQERIGDGSLELVLPEWDAVDPDPRRLPAEPPPEREGAGVRRLDRGAVRGARPAAAQEHTARPPRWCAPWGRPRPPWPKRSAEPRLLSLVEQRVPPERIYRRRASSVQFVSMNTTFEIGMTLAMLALWALAIVATSESRTPRPCGPGAAGGGGGSREPGLGAAAMATR